MKKVRLINVNPKHRRYGKTADVPESVLDKPKLEEDGWRLQGYIDENGNIISPNKKAGKPADSDSEISSKPSEPLTTSTTTPATTTSNPASNARKAGRPKGQGKRKAPAKPKDKNPDIKS